MLCTTVAIGILFWASAEPLYHLMRPPSFAAVQPGGEPAARFALSTMFLHWTFTPYAIYSVPALVFALSYYNYNAGNRYSLGSLVQPLFRRPIPERLAEVIDAVCLYSLVAWVMVSFKGIDGIRMSSNLGGLPALLLLILVSASLVAMMFKAG